jgi:hypothetical protein
MAEKTEYKKYDTQDKLRIAGARLAKDAESRDGTHGKMVRLTVVSTSRKDQHSDLWLEINVGDFHAEAASHLLKGDTVHLIEGKPCLRRYGDENEKWSLVLDRAEVIIPLDLQKELKERGWVPGESKANGAKAAKPAAKTAKPAAKPVGKPAAKKPTPVEIPDEDDAPADDGEDASEE